MASWRHLTRAYKDPLEADPRSGRWHRHDSITKQRRMFVKDPNYRASYRIIPFTIPYDSNKYFSYLVGCHSMIMPLSPNRTARIVAGTMSESESSRDFREMLQIERIPLFFVSSSRKFASSQVSFN